MCPLSTIKIHEIFYSIQGESLWVGKPTVFVRTTGCPLRCHWCDTKYAFHHGSDRSIDQILDEVARHATRYVCVTGGEPMVQPAVVPLMERLLAAGYQVSLETSGSEDLQNVPKGVVKVMDLKCPGSGETDKNLWKNLDLLDAKDQIKFVISDRRDFDWALAISEEKGLFHRIPLLFSPVHDKLPSKTLAEWVLESRRPITLQLQLHKLVWGAQARGV